MKLTHKHFRAMEMLYKGDSLKTICENLEISLPTLEKWRNDEEFKQALVSIATQQVGDLVPIAISELRKVLMDNNNLSTTDKLKAIKMVLDYAKINEKSEIEQNVNLKIEYI